MIRNTPPLLIAIFANCSGATGPTPSAIIRTPMYSSRLLSVQWVNGHHARYPLPYPLCFWVGETIRQSWQPG